MVEITGIEPVASSILKKCSTKLSYISIWGISPWVCSTFYHLAPTLHNKDAGPSGETRTRGILVPNQAPYQLGHTRIYGVEDGTRTHDFQIISLVPYQLGHPNILCLYYSIFFNKIN